MAKKLTLDREDTVLVVVDVQERLLPVIHGHEALLANIVRLVRGAQILEVPVICSEQYPKGLGPTVGQLAEALAGVDRQEKITFSCLRDDGLARTLENTGKSTLLVCGIESHVCVTQTVLDAIEKGLSVHVAADAVSSRNPENKRTALERLAAAGATITSTESALFELLGRAGTEQFKAISRLVK